MDDIFFHALVFVSVCVLSLFTALSIAVFVDWVMPIE